MNDEIKDSLKTFLIGMLLPVALIFHSFPYLIGRQTRSPRGAELGEAAVFWGLFVLGMALAIHGVFFGPYTNYPMVKYGMLLLGVSMIVFSFILR